MKKNILLALFVLFGTSRIFAQDIPQSQVPSVVVNSFQKSFPKATDVEWELQNADQLYKVEFETGLAGYDHDAWYDKTGKLVKHKEEISRNDLPPSVTAKINTDYKGYRIDDVKKITEGNVVTYSLEIKSGKEEWKLVLDAGGNVLSKVAD